MNSNKRIKFISIILMVVMMTTLFTGCGSKKDKERANTVTVYLWSMVLYDKYAPYIQAQLPDMNIQFIVGQNDLDFYKFIERNGELPDIIMSRRFSRHDAVALKDHLMDLSATEEAGAVYESYMKDFTNADGTINWLPICGTADGIVANKALFDKYNIPLPTDYDSFVAACNTFEEHGIRGFVSDFVYDYTCMEVLQGISIPEITSMEGEMWRSSYEDPADSEQGLDDTIWPVVFENMEQFIADMHLTADDLELDYNPIIEMYKEGKLAMFRDGGSAVISMNEEGIETMFLPYYGKDGEQWILTYPEFQVAVNKDVENDATRKENAMKVLNVMLSEGAQKVLSNKGDVITYNRNVNLEMSPYLDNIKPLIEQNHLYIRIASNDFFAASKEVVQKMIKGEYDAKQAYEAFDSQLRYPNDNQPESIYTQETGYSNIFYTKGGSESYSAMANTVRNMYGGDVLIAPGYSFTGSVLATEYTEKQISNLIMPNGLWAYSGEMTGLELKECVRGYVEGIEGGFTPFNRGSLPIVSGITIEVQEKDGVYTLLSVKKDGNEIGDEDVFNVVCLNTDVYMEPFMHEERPVLERADNLVRADLVGYITEGGSIEAPGDYITLKEK